MWNIKRLPAPEGAGNQQAAVVAGLRALGILLLFGGADSKERKVCPDNEKSKCPAPSGQGNRSLPVFAQ
jgi:hypothetical protein